MTTPVIISGITRDNQAIIYAYIVVILVHYTELRLVYVYSRPECAMQYKHSMTITIIYCSGEMLI